MADVILILIAAIRKPHSEANLLLRVQTNNKNQLTE